MLQLRRLKECNERMQTYIFSQTVSLGDLDTLVLQRINEIRDP